MLISAVVVLLSGWFETPMSLLLIVFAPDALFAVLRFYKDLKAETGYGLLFAMIAGAVATALLLGSGMDATRWTIGLAVALGVIVARSFIGPPEPSLGRGRGETLKMIGEAVRAPGDEDVKFRPSFPVETADEKTVWAIDPARRTLRVLVPANAAVDALVEWDEPIRAVSLKRAKISRWLPSTESRIRALRRDRDLEIVCGRSKATEWRFVFEFIGPDSAERWREVFESWMIKDRERIPA